MKPDFSFAILADSRGRNTQINKEVFGKLLNNIKKSHNIDFILFGGDMILGRSTSGVDADTQFILDKLTEWNNFVKNIFSRNSLKGFLFSAIGNHDVSNSQSVEESESAFNKAYHYLPSSANGMEMLKGYGKTVYYFDHLNSRFIVLNTRMKNIDNEQVLYGILKPQQDWLEEVLKNSNKIHNFVMFHYPAFGTEKINSLNEKQCKAVWKILDKYKVNAVYVGHEHLYNRRIITNAFFSDEDVLNNEIHQITSGGAGAPLKFAGSNIRNIALGPLSVYNYGIINVYGKMVVSEIYDINGSSIDYFTYNSAKAVNIKGK